MNQAFPGCTIEKLDGSETLVSGASGRAFQGSAECRALGAITDRGRAGFPHVLLG
jgi:hypothetical protein